MGFKKKHYGYRVWNTHLFNKPRHVLKHYIKPKNVRNMILSASV